MSATSAGPDTALDWQAVLLELRGNRLIVDELAVCYRSFSFTGGEVPQDQWELGAVAACCADAEIDARVVPADAQRYCYVAQAIMELGRVVALTGPQTHGGRQAIASTFRALAAALDAIESELASAAAHGLAQRISAALPRCRHDPPA